MEIEQVNSLVAEEMATVNRTIGERLRSDVVLISQIGAYIVHNGGKRLRPILHLLSARALHYTGSDHIELAAVIEFIHTATLLHDDVVDESQLRRGEETANARWGNASSVLVGDFLYSRAFEMMVSVDRMRVMQILAEATNTIAEGEVLQLLNCHDAETTEARYIEVIHRKTAKLFEAATRLGAVLAEADAEQEEAMAAFGMHLGAAFQLIDDVLDYSASSEQTGKQLGDDLAEGKPTLPLIHAMREGTPQQAAVIRDAIENGGRDRLVDVLAAIESTGAIAYTARRAAEEADLAASALQVIPDSPWKEAMQALARFSVQRRY